jgi:CubicO group peptidase (beta-lactamase class C family)
MNGRIESSVVSSWLVTTIVYGLTTIGLGSFGLAAPNEGGEKHKLAIEKFENSFAPGTQFKGDPAVTLQQRMEHYGVPGMCVAVVKDNQVIWTKAYGVMDRQTEQPVKTDTLFQCASISKPVSAAAALRLVELGKLDLKSDVNKFLKSWKLPENEFTRQKPVTLKHIVSHTGGLTVHGFLGYTKDQEVPSLKQLLDGHPPSNSGKVRVDKLPGGSIRYSGGGYCVMQQMMIDAYGGKLTFPEIMDQLVLDQLGMQSSTFEQPLPADLRSRAATGYLPNGQMVDGKQHTYPEMAPAGLYSTASELAQFFIDIQLANQGDDMRILSHRMAKKMLRPIDGRFGLGIGVRNHGGESYMGHGGWNEGFSSEAIFHQSRGYGVVVLTNSNHPAFVEETIRSVARVYDWHNFVIPEFEELPITQAQIEVLSGRYDHGETS